MAAYAYYAHLMLPSFSFFYGLITPGAETAFLVRSPFGGPTSEAAECIAFVSIALATDISYVIDWLLAPHLHLFRPDASMKCKRYSC